ncbi:hypothetical protein IV203_011667 [Nitzschia inconspicua]|uniref:Uncharacterized protein n=1 Tax=Nitzschia inconspicua TaxID=303405 RepID=A0A9K3KSI1_9STRA|nr:hypothetical protein IV203_011667 [Nitzschia inconspicua]
MPALRDEEFGFQVDQADDEESTEEDDDEESDDDDDDDEESGDESTEDNTGGEESGETEDDDDDDDDEETSDGDDKDESDDDDDDDEKDENADSFKDEDGEGLISGKAADRGTEDSDKKRQITVCVVCCLLLAIILGLGLGLGLKDKGDDETPVPVRTPAPTRNVTIPPTAPPSTMPPAQDETVDEVIVTASADTTIYVDGQFAGDGFGERDVMLVQGGTPGNPDLPRAFSLVQFNLNSTELAKLREPVEIEFCLEHVVSAEDLDRVVTYTACLLPFSSPVDQYTGTNVTFQIPADCIDGKNVTFDVSPPDELLCIPATNLVLETNGNEIDIRYLRARQQNNGDNRKLLNVDPVLVLAIFNPENSDQPGDQFYTSNDPEERGAVVEFMSTGDNATDVPSFEPNATEVPEPQYDPCSMCGNNFTATILDAEVPGADGLTCAAVQQACNMGFCDPDQCSILPMAVNEVCGCTLSPGDVVGI